MDRAHGAFLLQLFLKRIIEKIYIVLEVPSKSKRNALTICHVLTLTMSRKGFIIGSYRLICKVVRFFHRMKH